MLRVFSAVSAIVLALGCSDGESPGSVDDDVFSAAVFADPPLEFGPQARWWWPGGAVDDVTLREQLSQFAELGYSAVEIQPFMSAVTNADLSSDSRIRTVGDASFLERLRTAACTARELGLSWDLTLGSGWSTGGAGIDEDGARQLVAAELTLTGPLSYRGPLPEAEPPAWVDATNSILPAIAGFDENATVMSVLAAEVLEEPESSPAILGNVVDLGPSVEAGTLSWEVPEGTHRVFAIYENRTQHFPVGNAYPGPIEGARIIDHLDRRGVEAFVDREFGAWIDAVSDCSPRAVFVDSFELVGELPWTTAFGAKFESTLGYDVAPMLPFLFLEGGESEYATLFGTGSPRYRATDERGLRAREDYETFRGTLFVEELIVPLRAWLQNRGIDFRLQAHGGYADVLDAYGMADVPESEGLYGGGSYDFLRLAASAAHVGGKRFVSSETFPTVGTLELTEDEARLLMGRAFSAGVNRLMYHGHAYPYLHQDGQRWFPFHPLEDSAFSTGPLDLTFDIHPDAAIWAALPSLNRMVARLSYAMSRGAAAAEVAWLYPEWEAENFPNFGVEPRAFESEISMALRRAGFSYARLSRSALAASTSDGGELRAGAASFRALVVENVDAIDPEVLRAVLDAADAGVAVVWMGNLPERADGLVDADSRDAMVAALVDRLQSDIGMVSSANEIPAAITDTGVLPSLGPLSSDGFRMSVARRQVVGGDLYFLFNESYQQQTDQFRIEGQFADARLLDPDTGQALETNLDGDVLTVTLPGARSVVLSLAR
ncbi:MAG: glycosyl hydrolase [Myxococcales bacterium]|nr:glycosyl hydrolase [Myxococcales bacterium]MDH3483075.1 glycosyl hydrolase [Myxococcales bacterium]